MKPSPRPATPFLARIVVGIDPAGHADDAVRVAKTLADRCGARLTIVHAVGTSSAEWELLEDPRDSAKNAGFVAQAWRSTVRHVRELIGERTQDGRPIEDLVLARAGRPASVLLSEAAAQDADLVVLGYDLDRPRIDFGGTVRNVVAGSPKAVWIQKHAPTTITRILAPVDLSKDSLRALGAACALGRMFAAPVEALHAFSGAGYVLSAWPGYPDPGAFLALEELREAQRAAFEREMAAFDWGGVEHSIEFVVGDPAQQILQAQNRADLIVMGTHGRTGLASALLGSVAWHVIRQARRPVLAIRHPSASSSTRARLRPPRTSSAEHGPL
jgi:nucleotide-binding universal stress UspA family protein